MDFKLLAHFSSKNCDCLSDIIIGHGYLSIKDNCIHERLVSNTLTTQLRVVSK